MTLLEDISVTIVDISHAALRTLLLFERRTAPLARPLPSAILIPSVITVVLFPLPSDDELPSQHLKVA